MENKSEKPGYLFQLSYDLGEGKNMSVSGNFMTGATSSDMVGEIDKVMNAMDFTRSKRMELPAIIAGLSEQKKDLENQKIRLDAMRAEMNKLAEMPHRNTPQKSQYENILQNISNAVDAIERQEQYIQKGEIFVSNMKRKVEEGI